MAFVPLADTDRGERANSSPPEPAIGVDVAPEQRGQSAAGAGQITVRPSWRAYSPVLRQASLPKTITVPWWGGHTLRYQYD
jgi:hypothetical protein